MNPFVRRLFASGAALVPIMLYAPPVDAQDVFASGRAQSPPTLEARRNCSAPDPGPYVLRNAPSCARRIDEGRRQHGVEPTFLTLRESRQIPASWQYGSPWGPCAEGESMVFLTPAGRQLFEQTRGQCDDVYAGRPQTGGPGRSTGSPPTSSRGTPGAGPGTAGGSPADSRAASGSSGDAAIPQTDLPCFEPSPRERETVRGMPGGRSCELRNGDQLWCRQRDANTRNVWLPTNPSWPMKPVGVRVLADCRVVALEGDSAVRLKGRVEQNVGSDESPPDASRGAAEWKYVDLGNPTPVGDGMIAAFKECFEELRLFNRAQYDAVRRFDFVELERLLGLGQRDASGRLQQTREALSLSVEQFQADLLTRVDVSDFERGFRLGKRLCAYYPAAEALGGVGRRALGGLQRGASKLLSSAGQAPDFRPQQNPGKSPPRVVRDPARPGAQLEPDPERTVSGPHDLTDVEVLQGYTDRDTIFRSQLRKAIRDGVSDADVEALRETQRRTRPSGKRVRLSTGANGAASQTVQVGDFVGSGAFGEVFDVVPNSGGPAREVIKIVHNTAPAAPAPAGLGSLGPALDQGAASVRRQLQGTVLLNDAGIDTPLVSGHRIGTKPGDPSWIIMEKIDVSTGLVENFDGVRFPRIVKKIAVLDLFERMVAKNLVGADLHPGNVYFYADRTGRVRAGVWDTDFILRTDRPIDPALRSEFLFQVQGKQAARGITGQPFDFADPRASMEMMYRMQWEKR
jgi:hypothetical protein